MTGYWQGKVALVTGGSAGLGHAVARAFVARGVHVVLAARDPDRLERAARAISNDNNLVTPVAADVTRQEDVQQLFERVESGPGRLDVLVNNVGRSARQSIEATSAEDFQTLWETNFLSAVRCTQLALPKLLQNGGHVVNIGSLAAKAAAAYYGAYPVTKFALAAYSQQLRLELGERGLHVLLVCPGPIRRGDDREPRYAAQPGVPASAQRPGGGVKLKGLEPDFISQRILAACERRQPELVMPGYARWLFALSQCQPSWGDWIIRRKTSSTKKGPS